jgi:hypothetical protein
MKLPGPGPYFDPIALGGNYVPDGYKAVPHKSDVMRSRFSKVVNRGWGR